MNEDIEKIAVSNLGYNGRMISGSKSGYSRTHKKNLAVFNANVCTENGKIWYGDLDVTIEYQNVFATVHECQIIGMILSLMSSLNFWLRVEAPAIFFQHQ